MTSPTPVDKFKPLKGVTVKDLTKLKYPILASVKYDGIRALTTKNSFLSASLKPLPNKLLQEFLNIFDGTQCLDGELLLPGKVGEFNSVQSAIMSEHTCTDLVFKVFDHYREPLKPFEERLDDIPIPFIAEHSSGYKLFVEPVDHILIHNHLQLKRLSDKVIARGYEGLILRSPEGIYKFGRSTLNQGYMLKIKNFLDDEALIVGFEEQLQNNNKAKKNNLGRTERSSKKANKVPKNILGSLVVESAKFGQFKVGTGFTDEQRKHIWLNQDLYDGKYIKFSYLDASTLNKPRHPVYLGLRNLIDMTDY